MLPDTLPPIAGTNKRASAMLDAIHKLLAALVPYGQKGVALDALLSDGIWPVADVAEIDRLCVFRLSGDEGSAPRLRQLYRWMRSEGGTTEPVQTVADTMPDNAVTRGWMVELQTGKPVFFTRGMLDADEAAFARRYVLETVLLLPVFYDDGLLWGIISFEAHAPELRFDSEAITFLNSVARICTNFLIRAEKTRLADEVFEAYRRESETSLAILKAVLASLDALILVTVPETGEILFVNDAIKEFFGAEGDGTGKICYEFLHNGTQRCENCPYKMLLSEPDRVVSWDVYYPPKDCAHRLTSLLVDWPGGRKAQLDFGIDITDSKRAQTALEQREQMMNSLNGAALTLLSKEAAAFEEAMSEGIGMIAAIARIDRVSVSRNIAGPDGLYASQVYRWGGERGVTIDVLEDLQNNSYHKHIPRWAQVLSTGECINGPVSLMPEAQALRQFGCVSVLAIPVFHEGGFWGFVLFENLVEERAYTADEMEILRSASFMLANAVIRHEEQQIIREADEYARLMLDATPMCCTLWDADHNIVGCNEAILTLFGVEKKSDWPERFLDCCPERQADGRSSEEMMHEVLDRTFAEGRHVFEGIHQTLDGVPVPAEITMVRVKYRGGYVVAGYIRDLREHNRMMEEIGTQSALLAAVNRMSAILLRSEARAFERDLQRSMGVIARAVDADRVYIWKTREQEEGLLCSQIYEWSEGAEPQQDKGMGELAPYSDVAPVWGEILARGQCYTGIVRDMNEAQRAILVPQDILSILLVPIFVRGDFWGFLGFDDCHSERLFSEGEETILRSASELIAEALIRNEMEERLLGTAARLEQALGEAQQASRAKSEFLSRMSHEMRTPMNAIIGMTAIGKLSKTQEKKDYSFDKIDNASRHLLGVINDVLDMSKIEANKLELSHDDFVFDKMLQRVVNVLNFRVDEKRQKLYVNIDNNIPASLIGDDQRLAQVITNLLSNAIKFTPEEGRIHLDARLLSEEMGMCCLQISVTDTGIGLSAEKKARIFRSFEQGDIGTSRQYGGTGLGLSISRRIIELMEGEIWVESEEGQGAAFTFTALLRRGRSMPKRLLAPGVSWNNIRIFAVDDDYEIREFFLALAQNLGIGCEVAANGEEALGMLEIDNRYNIYFIDWKLPGMNGIELAGLIRERMLADSLVLLFSALDWTTIEMQARAAGISRFLPKPLFQSDIVDVINESLGLESLRAHCLGAAKSADDFAGLTVLLAEDMEINREIVLALLEPTGIAVECAEDGAQALRMVEQAPQKYALIFMDVQMPVMDGYEATRRIRAMDAPASDIPIVAMTANVFREDVERCLAAGMNAHIGKPFLLDEVLAALRKWVKER